MDEMIYYGFGSCHSIREDREPKAPPTILDHRGQPMQRPTPNPQPIGFHRPSSTR